MNKLLVCLILLLLPLPVFPASFDCAKAGTNIEKTICGDKELSMLDERLASVYKLALASSEKAEEIRESQKQWLEKERNNCDRFIKTDDFVKNCLKHKYQNRVLVLNALSTPKDKVFGLYTRKMRACFVGESIDKPDCYGDVEDKISVTQASNDIDVRMELYFFNGHTCEFEGKAVWKDGKLEVKGDERDTKCEFDLYSDGERIKSFVSDEMNAGCHFYCGARGSLNGAYGEKAN